MQRPSLLVLVRHGESAMNAAKKENVYLSDDGSAGLLKGVPDHKIPLTLDGLLQAEITGRALRERFGSFDAVYDSGYLRTQQTREKLLIAYPPDELRATKIRESHLLRERERGYTFNMTTEEVDRHFPWLKEYFQTFGYFYSRPPGGQSQADVCDQVYQFLGVLFAHRALNQPAF
jgi:2,3-bisphosphoglycerate-dependent phosphoglycerate mutase